MLELLLALPFALALVVALSANASRRTVACLAGLVPLLGLGVLAFLAGDVFDGTILKTQYAWIPEAGLDFSLRMDGLAWTFALMVLGIGGLVVLYGHYYLSAKDSPRRFFTYLLLFMGAMLGMVIAGNLLLLAVFWELTSISSFLLIGFWSHRQDARQGARMALTITGMGGLALLGGVLLIGRIVGSYDLDVVLASGDLIRASHLYPWALGLVLLGIFTKSAQFPFHFWLPHAMAAPTPVSAYLHSATMVKAGVFLLARLHPALAGTDLFFYVVSGVGATTLVMGAWFAIFQHDLKGLLAYSTISHLGLITLLFGLSTEMAVVAGLFHILNHAMFKASLFMAAGIIDHETGTRDMRRLGNLRRLMPMTSALAIVASLAMAGIPLLNGFLSKEMFFAEALEIGGHGTMRWVISIAALLAGVFGIAYSLRFVHDTFFGRGPRALDVVPHEPPRWMRIPVGVLAILCLVIGIIPALTVGPLLHTMARGTLGAATPEFSLSVWHGINLPLMMSVASLVFGVLLYFGLRKLLDFHAVVTRSTGRQVFQVNLERLFSLARAFTARVANGSLQRSLFGLLLVALVLAGWPLLGNFAELIANGPGPRPLPVMGWMIWAVIVASSIGTVVVHGKRLTALIVIGGVGLAVSLMFVYLSAPDLALTQLLVEMVTIALMMMALNYLPKQSKSTRRPLRKFRDVAISIVAGGGLGALAYAMMVSPADTISNELLVRSLPEAYGRNVVNVILVDFRGFDTFGEITVFGTAALVVHALLRWARLKPDEVMPGPPVHLPIAADLTQLLFPLALTVSIYLFLRGHNAPGGGFIAGLVFAVPVLVKYVLQGARAVEATFGFDYLRGIGVGLLLAVIGGVGSWWFDVPFLTSGHLDVELPLIGLLPLASALVFDTGVYVVVFAGTLLMLSTMGTVKQRQAAEEAH
ncbi:monovalent cation/H+ antiporter subunit A [Luteimonas fraxinea]|uniref:Monovalent cation/H+ antiporter subunit A n=1 Tax=Luteimonas fraxinea TaxID=2901869 RepID=A0ABS8UI27_9GAMM|nr:monovalent cation/H+ antiporter subunit A [Luteimonas fraxinea]MCD9098632.1 monovalent cation/H+ antiporter subunit A [Luteimonas fraxinea]MCD9127365.1 monovalent cation/H+ antiporter subunit A [Luteimonas fraxinea]UHH08966.1 monovalent cation/H+ antiporter subunit A [Luteimonas fraxinea]